MIIAAVSVTATEFVPLTIFAFLYGLSMDYEVFILARMREEYDRSGNTHYAVIEGVGAARLLLVRPSPLKDEAPGPVRVPAPVG